MRTAIAGVVGGMAGGALALASASMLEWHAAVTVSSDVSEVRPGLAGASMPAAGGATLADRPPAAAEPGMDTDAHADVVESGALLPSELVFGPPSPEPDELAAALRRYETQLQIARAESAARTIDAAGGDCTASPHKEGPPIEVADLMHDAALSGASLDPAEPRAAVTALADADMEPVASTATAVAPPDPVSALLTASPTAEPHDENPSARAEQPQAAHQAHSAVQLSDEHRAPPTAAAARPSSPAREPDELRALRTFRLTVPKDLPKVDLAIAAGTDPAPRAAASASDASAPGQGTETARSSAPRATRTPARVSPSTRIAQVATPVATPASDPAESATASAQASLRKASDAVKRLSRRMGGGYVR